MRMLFAAALLCLSASLAADPGGSSVRTEGALVYQNIPALDAKITAALKPYLEARVGSFVGWLPDRAGMLTVNRFANTNQLHLLRMPEGARRQLTFFDEPIGETKVSTSPEANGALFAKDTGGDEYFQIYFLNFATLQSKRLSPPGKHRNERPVFARDGKRFAYAGTARNGRDFDIYQGALGDQAAPKLIYQATGMWYPIDFSPDGSKLLLNNYRAITDNSLHELDLKTGKISPLFAKVRRADRKKIQEPAASPLAVYAEDGERLFFLSDLGGAAAHLQHLDLKSGALTTLTNPDDWEVEEFAVSKDNTVAVNFNRGGESDVQVFRFDAKKSALSEKAVAQVKLSPGVIRNIAFDDTGKRLGFTMNAPQIPGDAAELDLSTRSIVRWTENETGGLNRDGFVIPRVENVGSFDLGVMGLPRQIPAWYYQPSASTGPTPLLIIMHGGPEGQSRPTFDPWIQYLVRELGIAVLLPNVRGSSGYGRDFLGLDDGIKRMDSVQDMGAWIEWAHRRAEINSSRIAVYGGSYGGYMSLAALANYSNKIAGAISVVGISNIVSFLENTNPYRRDQRRQEYGDEQDKVVREAQIAASPLFKADAMSKPLFVIQGANDPRVPQSESEQIVKALSDRGIDVWYLLAKNEGHGFKRRENQDVQRVLTVQWLRSVFALDEKPSK
jgi:protease II